MLWVGVGGWCVSSLMPTSEVINVSCPSSLIDKARLCEAVFQDNGCERVIKHKTDVPQASISHVPPEIHWGVPPFCVSVCSDKYFNHWHASYISTCSPASVLCLHVHWTIGALQKKVGNQTVPYPPTLTAILETFFNIRKWIRMCVHCSYNIKQNTRKVVVNPLLKCLVSSHLENFELAVAKLLRKALLTIMNARRKGMKRESCSKTL